MDVGGWARGAARWLGRWLAITVAIYAAWLVVTLAQGGRLGLDDTPCRSPDANLIWIAAMSGVAAVPLVAVWAFKVQDAARWSMAQDPAVAARDEESGSVRAVAYVAAVFAVVFVAVVAALVLAVLAVGVMICFGSMPLSNVGAPLPPSP